MNITWTHRLTWEELKNDSEAVNAAYGEAQVEKFGIKLTEYGMIG